MFSNNTIVMVRQIFAIVRVLQKTSSVLEVLTAFIANVIFLPNLVKYSSKDPNRSESEFAPSCNSCDIR